MRCAQCGLPLSPTRNSCPRCGTPINTFNPASSESSPLPTSAFATQVPFPTPQQSQLSFEDKQGMLLSESTQQANMPASNPISNLPNRPEQPLAHKSSLPTRSSSKTTTLGLTSAGLCIIAGSLLLVFVYLVAQGFLPVGTTPSSNTQLSTIAKANQTATTTYLSTPTPLPSTPTPTLPGQGLLNISVLSNDFNSTQPLTDFTVNQKIYVVLSLYPGGTSRAVCLNWYLNDLSVNKFAFEVNPTSNYHYYSYMIMTATGKGRVDISLASTTACSDAIMAKTLPFTVSA